MSLAKIIRSISTKNTVRAFSTSKLCQTVTSVSQATIDKGHAEWDDSVRPLYMDAQVNIKKSIAILCIHGMLLYLPGHL